MEKLLTIIIPSYNMEAYLPKCLGSLIVDDAELLQKLDVIVVNDGSKDRTSEIAHDFERRYPGIVRVIDKPNGHYGSCINAALPLAQGKYVKILDADDSFDHAGFQDFILFLSSQPETVDVAIFDYDIVGPEGAVIEKVRYNLPTDRKFTVEELVDLTPKIVWMNVLAYRRALFEKTGYHQTEGIAYTDMEWNFIPMSAAEQCVYFPRAVHRYLTGRDGQTTQRQVQAKNLPMTGRVALSLMRWGRELNIDYDSARGKYLERIISSMLTTIYMVGLFEFSVDNTAWLKDFDRMLNSDYPRFYELSDRWMLSRKLRFYHVRTWRRSGSRTGAAFKFYRVYRKLIDLWKRSI